MITHPVADPRDAARKTRLSSKTFIPATSEVAGMIDLSGLEDAQLKGRL